MDSVCLNFWCRSDRIRKRHCHRLTFAWAVRSSRLWRLWRDETGPREFFKLEENLPSQIWHLKIEALAIVPSEKLNLLRDCLAILLFFSVHYWFITSLQKCTSIYLSFSNTVAVPTWSYYFWTYFYAKLKTEGRTKINKEKTRNIFLWWGIYFMIMDTLIWEILFHVEIL